MTAEQDKPQTDDRGFTLLEVMVALAVFSLAAVAMIKLSGHGLATSAALQEKALATLVAENQLVDVMVDPQAPDLGVSRGDVTMGAREWRWERQVLETGNDTIRRVDIVVRRTGQDQVLASLSGFLEVGP